MAEPLLSSQRLAEIAARWEENMVDRVVVLPVKQIYDQVSADTPQEYPEPTEAGLTSYPARGKPIGPPDEATVADQERAKAWWELQLPVRSRIQPTDRLYWTGRDASGASFARTLQVVGPSGPRTWEAVRLVKCWEILPTTATVEG